MRPLSLSTAAKVAIVAVLAATAGGVGLIVWAVVATGGPGGGDGEFTPADLSDLTLEEAYARIAEAIARPGLVLHSTLEARGRDATGEMTPYYTKEFWIDAERETLREEFRLDPERDSYDIAEESLAIVVGEYIYVPDDPSEALRFEVEDFCPRTTEVILSAFLECGGSYPYLSLEGFEARGEPDTEYEGRPAVALVFEQGEADHVTTTLRLYLDRDSFLPVARVVEYRQEGELLGELVSAYKHEFVPADSLPDEFLDPRSIGYGAENEDALLDEIAGNVPVYWLGSEFEPGNGFRPLVLVRIAVGNERGMSGRLQYETPSGVPGVQILLWRPEEWQEFMRSVPGRILTDSGCVRHTELDISGRQVPVYVVPWPEPPLPATPRTPQEECALRIVDAELMQWSHIAFLDLGDVVVDVRTDVVGYHDSLGALEVVVERLQAR